MKIALAITIALVACGPKRTEMLARDAPVPWQRSGIDWTKPPPLATPAPLAAPRTEVVELDHGMRVIVVPNHRLPLVAISAVHAGAGSREDGATPGLAALTADLLDEGAGNRRAPELRDRLEHAGATLDIRIASDHASMQLVAASQHTGPAIALLADLIRAPRFETADFARVRADRLRELEERKQRPRTVAAQIFDRVVFGAHPYALPAEGSIASVGKLTVDDVRAFWVRAYRPASLTLIIAGDVRVADVKRIVAPAFRGWTGAPVPSPTPPLPAYSAQLAYVDMPGVTQSAVLIGTRAEAAGGERQVALDVANSIIGGGIGARLDRELHERLALSVGVSASYWRGRLAGTWALATTFARDQTLAGIRAALGVIDTTRTGVTAAELTTAQRNLTRGTEQMFDTNTGTTRALERAVSQGLPLDWYRTYGQRLAQVTLEHVRTASAWRDLSIVVVGDFTKLKDDLTTLGLPLVRYDRDGNQQP